MCDTIVTMIETATNDWDPTATCAEDGCDCDALDASDFCIAHAPDSAHRL